MPLTLKNNGSGSSNLIGAQWFNDYTNLFTGVMQDQPVTFVNNLTLQGNGQGASPPSSTPSTAAHAGTQLGIGTYTYAFTWNSSDGTSDISPTFTQATTSGNQQVSMTTFPLGPLGTTSRNIYRGAVNSSALLLLATINDNVTTTYLDATPDSGLSTTPPPTNATFGGTLFFVDQYGATNGYIRGADTSGWVEVIANAHFGVTVGGNESFYVDVNGTHIPAVSGNAVIYHGENFATHPSALVVGAAFGIKNFNNTKLFEVKANGQVLVSGSSVSTNVPQGSFDGYDVAESVQCDQSYPEGTLVCPSEGGIWKLCTHDNCFAASVISYEPGFQMGHVDHEAGLHPIALAGRVNVRTSAEKIGYRKLVCSDGKGGVRPLYPDEPSFAIGFTITAAENGMVGVFLRPMYVTQK